MKIYYLISMCLEIFCGVIDLWILDEPRIGPGICWMTLSIISAILCATEKIIEEVKKTKGTNNIT